MGEGGQMDGKVEEIRVKHEITMATVAKMFDWQPLPMQEDMGVLLSHIDALTARLKEAEGPIVNPFRRLLLALEEANQEKMRGDIFYSCNGMDLRVSDLRNLTKAVGDKK